MSDKIITKTKVDKTFRFGNLMLHKEQNNKVDYYRLIDVNHSFSVRWRYDTVMYRNIQDCLNDFSDLKSKKHDWLDRQFTLIQFMSSRCLTPNGQIKIAEAYRDDILELSKTIKDTEEDNQKTIEEERKRYEDLHPHMEVDQPEQKVVKPSGTLA